MSRRRAPTYLPVNEDRPDITLIYARSFNGLPLRSQLMEDGWMDAGKGKYLHPDRPTEVLTGVEAWCKMTGNTQNRQGKSVPGEKSATTRPWGY